MNPVQQFLDFLTSNNIPHDHTPGGATDLVRVPDFPSGTGYADWTFVNTALDSIVHHSS